MRGGYLQYKIIPLDWSWMDLSFHITKSQLLSVCLAWSQLKPDFLQALVDEMSERVKKCVKKVEILFQNNTGWLISSVTFMLTHLYMQSVLFMLDVPTKPGFHSPYFFYLP